MPDRQVIHVRTMDGDSVKELDVTGKTRRQIERIADGMSINLDHEHYRIDTTEALTDDDV